MPSVPALPAMIDGIVDASMLGRLGDVIAFLRQPPIAELRQTSAQTLTTGVYADVLFDVEDLDTDVTGNGGHSTSVNTARYTARYPGWYQVGGGVGFASSATLSRACRWAVNGVAVNGTQVFLPSSSTVAEFAARTKHVYLDIGDYVTLQAWQNSGGNLNTNIGASDQSSASIRWVSA